MGVRFPPRAPNESVLVPRGIERVEVRLVRKNDAERSAIVQWTIDATLFFDSLRGHHGGRIESYPQARSSQKYIGHLKFSYAKSKLQNLLI
jgi:hypothetical protein